MFFETEYFTDKATDYKWLLGKNKKNKGERQKILNERTGKNMKLKKKENCFFFWYKLKKNNIGFFCPDYSWQAMFRFTWRTSSLLMFPNSLERWRPAE